MSNKTLVIPVDTEIFDWVSKSKKEMKMKSTAEFVRSIINHIRSTSEIVELKRKMERTMIVTQLQEATAKLDAARKEQEVLEKRLEKVTVE